MNEAKAQENPYDMDTFKLNAGAKNSSLSTCRLEYGNGVFSPEIEYDAESKVRIYNDFNVICNEKKMIIMVKLHFHSMQVACFVTSARCCYVIVFLRRQHLHL